MCGLWYPNNFLHNNIVRSFHQKDWRKHTRFNLILASYPWLTSDHILAWQESSVDSSQWRNIKQHVLPYGSSRPLTRKLSLDASSSDSRGMEASTSMPTDNTAMAINAPKFTEVREITATLFSTTNILQRKIVLIFIVWQGVDYGRQPMVASSTLVELTTRLDFFKERRSQLMEQLHSLDLGHGSASQGFPYNKPPSPWDSPR